MESQPPYYLHIVKGAWLMFRMKPMDRMIRVKSTIKLRTGRDVPFLLTLERDHQGVEKSFAFLCIMRHCPLLRGAPNVIAGIYDTNDNHSHSSFLPVAGGNFEVLFYSCPQVSLVHSRKIFGGHQALLHSGRHSDYFGTEKMNQTQS